MTLTEQVLIHKADAANCRQPDLCVNCINA